MEEFKSEAFEMPEGVSDVEQELTTLKTTLVVGPDPDQEVKAEIVGNPDLTQLYNSVIFSLTSPSKSSFHILQKYDKAMDKLCKELMAGGGFTNFEDNAKGRSDLRKEIFEMDMTVNEGGVDYTPQKALARYICQPIIEYFQNMNAAIASNTGMRDELIALKIQKDEGTITLAEYALKVAEVKTRNSATFLPYLEANPLTLSSRSDGKSSLKSIGKGKFKVYNRVQRFLSHENGGLKPALLSDYIPSNQYVEAIKLLMSAYVADANIYARRGLAVKPRRLQQMDLVGKVAGIEGYYENNPQTGNIGFAGTIEDIIDVLGN